MISKIKQSSRETSEWLVCANFNRFSEFEELIKELHNAMDGDTIVLRLSSEGGRADIGSVVVQAIQSSQAVVVGVVVNPCYSMASLVALACDTLYMMPDTFLMFHTYSWGTGGKSDDVIQHVRSMDKISLPWMTKLMRPFLTKKELESINDGKDLYIHADDVDLQKRIDRHFKSVKLMDSN